MMKSPALAHAINMVSSPMTNGDADIRYLAASAEIEEPNDLKSLSGVTWAVCGVVLAFLVWAGIANISAVTRTSGEVIPSGSTRVVQHQAGGVIKEIRVQEGQLVEKGETLVTLSGDGLVEDLRQASEKQRALLARKERFHAFLDDRKPDFASLQDSSKSYIKEQENTFKSMADAVIKERDVIKEQRKQKYQALLALQDQIKTVSRNREIAQEIYDSRKKLVEDGYYPRVNFLETERNLNELKGDEQQLKSDIAQAKAALAEYDQRLALQNAKSRDDAYAALDGITADIAQNQQVIDKLEARVKSLAVTSPVRGLVKTLSVNSIGAVVGSGQVIAEIVPLDEALIVEIKIAPKDIGNVRVGQPVDVKFSAYDYAQFGSVKGNITYISATTFYGKNGERFYRGKVSLSKNYVGGDPKANPIIPGMTVMADIVLGDRTLLAQLLSPARKVASGAFKE